MSQGDPNHIEGVRAKSPRKASFPWLRASVFVVVVAGAVLVFTPPGEKILRGVKRLVLPTPPPVAKKDSEADDLLRQLEAQHREKLEELENSFQSERTALKKQLEEAAKRQTAAETPEDPEPPLSEHTAKSGGDVSTLRSGIPFKTEVKVEKGTIASRERKDRESYTAEYTLKIRVPEPSKTMEQLQTVNPKLSKLLPGLPAMMEKPEVSRWFFALYDNKTERLKKDATRLNELLTKHNYYDCETVLNLKHPQSGRKVFLLQAEMDVVSDGSDGDRLATMPDEIVN